MSSTSKKQTKSSLNTSNARVSPYFVTKKEKRKKTSRVESIPLIPTKPSVKYDEAFFDQETQDFAKALLGQLIVHIVDGQRLSGFVVETECYLGDDDVASHSYKGKKTVRNEPMFMVPGTAYVYYIYGMYHCFNISCKGEGTCVLIRAMEPLEGISTMETLRQSNRSVNKKFQKKELCNGPSKLCTALNIKKDNCNKVNMATSDLFWVEKGSAINSDQIVTSKRIGIESAGPIWANKPLRFYILGNSSVSFRDKQAEEILENKKPLQKDIGQLEKVLT